MMKAGIYGDSRSGNCYKLRLAASQLGLEHAWYEVDILAGQTRTPDYLAMNPNGKVPLFVLEDGRCLPESNAILWYFAEGTALLQGDRYARANVLAWMCFEQYSHEPYIATSRFIIRYLGNPADRAADLERNKARGYRALDVMEAHLGQNDFFANGTYSIADIALFAYTHVADEGGFDLSGYPAIDRWLDRVRRTEGFVAMTG